MLAVIDPAGLVVTVLFVVLALLVIPLDQWLDRRRARKEDE